MTGTWTVGYRWRKGAPVVRFQCVVCGKLTAGRLPINPHNHREVGDGTFRYPRRHKGADGKPCPGNAREAEWVNTWPAEEKR